MELKCLVPSLRESLGQRDLIFIQRFVVKIKLCFEKDKRKRLDDVARKEVAKDDMRWQRMT